MRLVALDVDRAQHRGEHHARAEFGRQQLQVQAERAEPRLDRGVRQREQRARGACPDRRRSATGSTCVGGTMIAG